MYDNDSYPPPPGGGVWSVPSDDDHDDHDDDESESLSDELLRRVEMAFTAPSPKRRRRD